MSPLRLSAPIITDGHDLRVLAAFRHSPEYLAVECLGDELRYPARVLELADELWTDPDDITGAILVELLHDLWRVLPYSAGDIAVIVRELRAFWSFAAREFDYPHAVDCLRALDREAALALECALQATPRRVRTVERALPWG